MRFIFVFILLLLPFTAHAGVLSSDVADVIAFDYVVITETQHGFFQYQGTIDIDGSDILRHVYINNSNGDYSMFDLGTLTCAGGSGVHPCSVYGDYGSIPEANKLNYGLTVNQLNSLDTPSFSVHRNGTNQTVTTGVVTLVDFTSEVFDNTSAFDLSTDRFTPGISGKFLLTGAAQCTTTTGASSFCTVMVYKNGAEYARVIDRISANTIGNSIAVVVDAAPSDYFELRVQMTGTNLNGTATATYFSGHVLLNEGYEIPAAAETYDSEKLALALMISLLGTAAISAFFTHTLIVGRKRI